MVITKSSWLRYTRHTCLASAVSFSLMSGAAQATQYTFQSAAFPGDTFTQLLGINNASVIAGYHGAGTTPLNPNQGFTLTLPNNFTNENFPGSVQTQVVGINNSGNTAGFYIDIGGTTHGFLNTGGTFSTVDAPGTAFNQLLGLNASGQAAGYSSTDSGGGTLQRAYINQGTTFAYIDALSILPPGTQNNQATGINNAGMVSGFYVDAGGVNHGFLLSGLTSPVLTTLDFLGSTFTQALGLNNVGQIVGDYMDASGLTHGFVDTNGQFQSVDDPLGLGTTTINGINDKGQIVGFFVDANDNTIGFVGTPLPEPGSFALTGLGMLAMMGLRRKARRRMSVKCNQTDTPASSLSP